MKKDDNYIARLEKAIAEKYGKDAIKNPASGWTKEKEEEYISQLKKLFELQDEREEQVEKVDAGGFLVSKKLLNKEKRKNCRSCNKYFFKNSDDIYMNKHGLCEKCYLVKQDTENIKFIRKEAHAKEQKKN